MKNNSIILTQKNLSKLKNEIMENKGKTIVFSSEDDELNRKVLEKFDLDVLLINLADRRDFQKQRNSGFNHVLGKIAKKRNVSLGVNFDEILNSDLKDKSEIFARLRQNIKLCNKNKLEMDFVMSKKNERDIYGLKALGLVLGMPTWMCKKIKIYFK